MTNHETSPDLEEILGALKGQAFLVSRHEQAKSGLTASVFLPAEALAPAVEKLDQAGYSLEDLSLVDTQEGFLAVYHFYHFRAPGARLALRALAPRDGSSLPSISHIFGGADWHEREAHDFYGLVFEGHPNLIPLLLPDDFPGPPPLLKDDKARAPLSALGLLGTSTEFMDPAWEARLNPPKAAETPKAEGEQ